MASSSIGVVHSALEMMPLCAGMRTKTKWLPGPGAPVVGVILNLAVWFALHVLFGTLREFDAFGMTVDVPELSSIKLPSLVLTLGAMLAVFRFKVGMIPVLLGCSMLGLVYGVVTGAIV